MKKYIIILALLYWTVPGFAQQVLYIDSLKKLISIDNKEDTAQVNRLLHLSHFYVYNKPDSGMYYANSALRLSQKLGYTQGEAGAYMDLGGGYMVLGDYAQAMQNMLHALSLYREMNRPADVGFMESYIGDIYKEIGDYKQALNYYFGARKMIEIYMAPRGSMYSDVCIGEAYLIGNKLDSALFFARRGYAKDRELASDWTYPALVLGNVYLKRNQLDSALYCYQSTFKDAAQSDQVQINIGIATVFRKQNKPDSCRYYAKMAFDTAQAIQYQKGAMRASELLSWVYEKNSPVEAINYYKIGTAIKDSLYNQEKIGRANFLVFNKKMKEQELQSAREEHQNRLKVYGLLVVVGFFLIIAIFLWRSNRHRQMAYTLLQNQKQETDHQRATAEQALEQLKATQSQLIQSEKMASLGQLTAGIAHEIQNPLNFVNNFSEVSGELIVEAEEERAKSRDARDETLVSEILRDIKENLGKINHHGKRADAIVKGMLEHSKTGSGVKELTNVNTLAGEYLNIAYQSFKSKNKDIEIELITDFDSSLPKIELVRSDIGKVLLNILNNAFYACTERDLPSPDSPRGENLTSLRPLVTVSTKNLGDKIQISIKDNGPGIPDSIKDKIFQPFFTTKPTGQGTGLGLSLAYDIVKAHGGEIRVESSIDQGTLFSIHLPHLQGN
ncbi:ATP-binding protein [Aquiflexum sp.]|uniref:ATP-binding protein n=1 Tax=Aquiflexum sp. TaxID=1872584 RepID=UPI0035930823